jgi:hypothetical protein
MRALLREALVTAAAGLCLAGPVVAVVVPLSPAAWRRPAQAWAILLGAVGFVAWLRRRARKGPRG